MKKLLIFISAMFVGGAYATTVNIDWLMDGQTYAQTTCETGGNFSLPSPTPTKYGYHFVGWSPSYTFLEYIESTGTQYIDTGIVCASDVSYEIKAYFDSANPQGLIRGSESGGSFGYESGQYRAWKATELFFIPANRITDGVHTVKYTIDSLSIDGVVASAMSDTGNRFAGNFMLFRAWPTNVFVSTKIYEATMFVSGVKIRNLVPAKRNIDNAIGMYDSVTGTFFGNAGTGTFIAGPEK